MTFLKVLWQTCYWLRRSPFRSVAALFCLCCLASESTHAGTVTRKVFVNFNGVLSGGNVYTLGSGEIDVTGTFRKNGGATIAGGIADIPGDADASSGFLFNAASLGLLTTTSWVTESILVPDVPTASQPGTFNHFLDVQGDVFFRYSSNGQPKRVEYGFYDGANNLIDATPNLPTATFSHVALTWNASTKTLEGFIDGVSQGTLSSGNPFATPSTNVGYGFFSRTGFLNRAFNGKLGSVAFSTFTGAFNPGFGVGFDFQLNPAEAPGLTLSLDVDPTDGRVFIYNKTTASVSLQGYQLSSSSGSLDVSAGRWTSLADQNLDPVMGGNDPGERWQEGANPSSQAILEGFLLGSTTLGPGQFLNLGRPYNEALDARDLSFAFRVAGQSGVIPGVVNYNGIPAHILGDYDNNTMVDGRDFLVWQRALGTTTPLPNDATPGSVGASDLGVWQTNFGAPLGVAAATDSSSASVPEPTETAPLLGLMVAAKGVMRRRHGRHG